MGWEEDKREWGIGVIRMFHTICMKLSKNIFNTVEYC